MSPNTSNTVRALNETFGIYSRVTSSSVFTLCDADKLKVVPKARVEGPEIPLQYQEAPYTIYTTENLQFDSLEC